MLQRVLHLLFPPKCVLCKALLGKEETDLCHRCRSDVPMLTKTKFKLSFLARWTAVWYYKDDVRSSILRFKFYNRRSYASAYGRLLAMQLLKQDMTDFDILTWVPVGPLRRIKRGYDQCQLLAQAVGDTLGVPVVKTLVKVRNTPPQSTILKAEQRRANVLGAYKVVDARQLVGKRILLLDDIITTGATASECAKTLLSAGAKEIYCGAVAAASHDEKKNVGE